MSSDPFWYDNPSILWNFDRLTEFFPSKNQSNKERLNAITRLCIYIAILLYINKPDVKQFYLVIGVLIFTLYVNYNDMQLGVKPIASDTQLEGLESEQQCTKPTIDNPFMNVTMKDYMNINNYQTVDRPAACNPDDPNVKKEIDNFFNNNLYRDVDDVFGKMNSQRQFFTMPSTTIPNAQDEFAKWLYLSPKTCKEDQDFCLKYEDVRAKRQTFGNPNENPYVSKDVN